MKLRPIMHGILSLFGFPFSILKSKFNEQLGVFSKLKIHPHVPQDIWSRGKHIDLVNIIGEPLASVTTRSRIRDSKSASAHECLYVNLISKIKPKKLIEALKEEGRIIAMQEELNQFKRNKEGIDYGETFALVARLEAIRIFLAYVAYMVS
ncbi:hypothetical protein Tco_1186358 [Tanacetum coccineum]